MNLGFDLGISGAARSRAAPWWHAYRAGPAGPLPAMVLEGEGGRLHGATQINATTLDLSSLDLSGGYTIYVRGHLDYTLGDSGGAHLFELTRAGTWADRQVVWLHRADGRVYASALKDSVQQFGASLLVAAHPSGQTLRATLRGADGSFASNMDNRPLIQGSTGQIPVPLDRLYLRSSFGVPVPGQVDRVVVWDQLVPDAALEAYAA